MDSSLTEGRACTLDWCTGAVLVDLPGTVLYTGIRCGTYIVDLPEVCKKKGVILSKSSF